MIDHERSVRIALLSILESSRQTGKVVSVPKVLGLIRQLHALDRVVEMLGREGATARRYSFRRREENGTLRPENLEAI
jgi:hypothetical protein